MQSPKPLVVILGTGGTIAGRAATRTDTTGYTAGAGYRPTRNLRLGINGDWYRRESQTSAGRGFDNNRIYGTLTWGI